MNTATSTNKIVMECPCCGGEVTHQRYGFDVITASPLRIDTWYVCGACEKTLTGPDAQARHRLQRAFLAYLGRNGDA